MYSTTSFYFGMVLADLPWYVLMCTIFTLITYFAYNFALTV